MEKSEVIQKLILFTSEITLLILFTSEITLFEICMLFHQYFPVFHSFVYNNIKYRNNVFKRF